MPKDKLMGWFKAMQIGTLVVALALPMDVLAQGTPPLVNGEVTKVDQSTNKVTIKHGPIPNLGMNEPSMTMVFPVQNPQMLKKIKPGDKIKFTADRLNGIITITKIQK
jgi:Cu(I)/Ag(I) efflux system periplasmic protein CusF